MADLPGSSDIPYRAVLTAIIQRFMRLIGGPVALALARKVPGLVVDDDGRVLEYDQSDPLNSVTLLTEGYASKFGEAAVSLSRQAAQTVSRAHADRLLPSPRPADEKGAPIRVLLVDDHELFRQGLAGLLEAQTDLHVLGQAGSVQEAVALARALQPDVVIMDLTLPDGTGVEATRAILAERPETRIVCLTVHDDDERLFAAIRAGAMGYLFKNTRANDLLAQIRGVARGEVGLAPALAVRILNEFSRTPPPRPADPGLTTELTPREIEIVRELTRGASNRQIARRFVISEYTVKNHVRNVLAKLRLRSRREVASYARDHGLTGAPPPP